MNKENILDPRNLEFEEWYDPRTQLLGVFLREIDKKALKATYYKLVTEERDLYTGDIVDDSCFKLMGHNSLKELLQVIVNYAYDRHSITPSSMKLQNDAQKYHLEDMRKLAFDK